MAKDKTYTLEYKQKLVMEILSGASVASISKREGIAPNILNHWREEYLNGTDIEKVDKKELLTLRKRVVELSRLIAEIKQENEILKENQKNPSKPKEKRTLIQTYLAKKFGVVKSLEALNLSSSTYYYKAKPKEDETWLIDLIKKILKEFPSYGHRRIKQKLEEMGYNINHKRIIRIMHENGLMSQRKIF